MSSQTDLNLIFDRLRNIEARLDKLECLQAIEESVQAADEGIVVPFNDVKTKRKVLRLPARLCIEDQEIYLYYVKMAEKIGCTVEYV